MATSFWTVAYRKRTANRFLRVDLALTWQEASDLGNRMVDVMPGQEVYVVANAAYDAAHPDCVDSYNVLSDTGRRVKIVEGGELPEGIHAPGTEPTTEPTRPTEEPAPMNAETRPAATRPALAVKVGQIIAYAGWEHDTNGRSVQAAPRPAVVIAPAAPELALGRAAVWFHEDERGPVTGVTVQPLWADSEFTVTGDMVDLPASVLERWEQQADHPRDPFLAGLFAPLREALADVRNRD